MSTDENALNLVKLAVSLHQAGHIDDAEELYEKALKHSPHDSDALHFLGVLRHQQGRSEEAVKLIRTALHVNPDYLDARVNLGNVLKETEQYEAAEAEYREVIRHQPENAGALNNLGVVLRVLDRTEDSIDCFQKAIELASGSANFYQNLGNALKAKERTEEALTAYRKAVELNPKLTTAHLSLGRALYAFGRIDEARVVYEKWLEIDPGNAVAKHMIAACQGDETPARCTDEFVKESFDAFAASFDEVLERLDYRAPSLVEEAVQEVFPEAQGDLDVLDAGCGTGLCGEALRPYAQRLIGIDLSPQMLVRAKPRNVYDELNEIELTKFMMMHPEQFDLIVSADTLVYFGDLEKSFDSACYSLRKSGRLVFTVEHLWSESESGFQLNPHGRYSHTESYVRDQLNRCGFTVRNLEKKILRMEVRRPVEGLVVTAQKEMD